MLSAVTAVSPPRVTPPGGEDSRGPNTDSIINRSLSLIPNFESLRNLQQRKHIFGKVRSQPLYRTTRMSKVVRIKDRYVLDDNDF